VFGFRLGVAALAAVTFMAGACASAEPVSLENLGLSMEVDIQAGGAFEVTVPVDPDTRVSVVAAPRGVTAAISEAPDERQLLLSVAVHSDTPRGAYNLALLVTRDGRAYELGWPFDVVDPNGGSPAGTTVTTQAGSVDALLTVDSPQVGTVFTGGSVLRGETSSPTVAYRLASARGDTTLAEGTVTAFDVRFSTIVGFTNTCCIEMVLEVFQPTPDGLALTIPLTYPESG